MTVAQRSIPGVYRRAAVRSRTFRRVRTDILGVVGVAGPRHLGEAVAVDDWRSYVSAFLTDSSGNLTEPPAGSRTSEMVEAFFANGGARVVIVNIAEAIREGDRDKLLDRMLGLELPTEPMERIGLELLLLQAQVSLVALPELDATFITEVPEDPLPPSAGNARFVACAELTTGDGDPGARRFEERLYSNADVLFAQGALLKRLREQSWRWFAVLAPPPGTTAAGAREWKDDLVADVGPFSNAALYWPWLAVQSAPGAKVRWASPIGFVAGAIAKRDLADGPHLAPANVTVTGAVAVERNLDEDELAAISDAGINPLRTSPGHGIELWGARTLRWKSPEDSVHDGLAYVNVRRCLTAIERTAEVVGQPAVFEPNLPILRVQLTQVLVGYLMTVFESGALEGASSDQAFRVRCDASNNPPELVDAGQLVCEIDVAIAKPAEFIEFRVGRKDGVIEIEEAA